MSSVERQCDEALEILLRSPKFHRALEQTLTAPSVSLKSYEELFDAVEPYLGRGIEENAIELLHNVLSAADLEESLRHIKRELHTYATIYLWHGIILIAAMSELNHGEAN